MVSTGSDITSPTARSPRCLAAATRTTSRSVTMPTGRAPSTTTTEPTRWSCMRCTTSWSGSAASALTAGVLIKVSILIVLDRAIASASLSTLIMINPCAP